jgi:hypothetical protein
MFPIGVSKCLAGPDILSRATYIRTILSSELNKIATRFPQVLSLPPGLLAARWATLKQMLWWNDRQCREAVIKYPFLANAAYGHQYVLNVAQCCIGRQ